MKENFSTNAIIQICIGTFLIIFIAVDSFIFTELLRLEWLLIGISILLMGLSNNTKDKSKRGKTLTLLSVIFQIAGVTLLFYNIFLR